jgi:hypothetical protein
MSYHQTAIVATKTVGKFDRAAILAHCEAFHAAAKRANIPGGKVCLAVYGEDPDNTEDRFAQVRHFEIGDVEGMTAAAMAFDGVPHQNVYSPCVVFKPETPAGTRQEKDIVAVLALVVDSDADKGKEAPKSPLPADYTIESSAGNHQDFLWLDRPLPPEEAKAFGNALKRATGADAANEIGHVWRVPGCLNWPNAVKVHKRGRSRDPQPVKVKWPWSKWTDVGLLRAVLEPYWEAPRAERAERTDAPPRRNHEACPDATRKVLDWLIENDKIESDEEWRTIAMVLRDEFGDDPGLGLFSRICHGQSVDAKGLARWNSFKRENGVGIGTLRMMATAAGCPHSIRNPLRRSSVARRQRLPLPTRRPSRGAAYATGASMLPRWPASPCQNGNGWCQTGFPWNR